MWFKHRVGEEISPLTLFCPLKMESRFEYNVGR